VRFLRARGQAQRQPARGRGAGARRRLRFRKCARLLGAFEPARLGGDRAGGGRAERAQPETVEPLRPGRGRLAPKPPARRGRSVGEEGEAQFMRVAAERIYDVAGARSRFARAVRLSMNGEASNTGAAASAKLKTLLEPYRNGRCPVEVLYKNGGASVEMQLGD